MPLEDAGLLGVDKGQGGKFLVLPPGYKDKAPDGFIPLQSDTFGGYMLFRSNLKSHSAADVQTSIDYGRRMKVYPLAPAAHPPATVIVDVQDGNSAATVRYAATVFSNLNRDWQEATWIDRDLVIVDQLKSLGIEKGKPFKPSEGTKALMSSADNVAGEWLEA